MNRSRENENSDALLARLQETLLALETDPAKGVQEAAVWVDEAKGRVEEGLSLAARGAANQVVEDLEGAEADFVSAGKAMKGQESNYLSFCDLLLAEFLIKSRGRYDDADILLKRVARRGVSGLLRAHLEMVRGIGAAKRGEYPRATRWLRHALSAFDRLDRPVEMARAMANLAAVDQRCDRLDAAREGYDRAGEIFRRHGLTVLLAKIDLQQSAFLRRLGRYEEALSLAHESAVRFSELGMPVEADIAHLRVASVALEVNLVAEGMEAAATALVGFESREQPIHVATAQAAMGALLTRKGDLQDAEALFRKARATFAKHGQLAQSAELSWDMAEIFRARGELRDAMKEADKAARSFAVNSQLLLETRAKLTKAAIYAEWGQWPDVKRLLSQIRRGTARLKSQETEWQTAYLEGLRHRADGNLKDALTAFQSAVGAIETARGQLSSERFRLSYVESRLAAYAQTVSVFLESGDISGAFALADGAKSRTLLEMMPSPSSDRGGSERLAKAWEELHWLYGKLDASEKGQRVSGLPDAELSAKLVRLETVVSREWDRSLDKIRLPESEAATHVGRKLGQAQAMLHYTRTAEGWCVFVVRADRIRCIRLPDADTTLALLLAQWDSEMGQPLLGQDYMTTHQDRLVDRSIHKLKKLGRILVEPVLEFLEGVEAIVVVPHTLLYRVPWPAVQVEGTHLSQRWHVSVTPSAGLWCSEETPLPRSDMLEGALVLGVPDEMTPTLAKEARAVSELLPGGRLHLGKTATKETLEKYGASSKVVHMACHGLFRPDNPAYSLIRLADGYVTAKEISRMRLPADLVTASACESGAVSVAGGDEMVGLARAFFAAGARRLLLSLWRVDDSSTTALITEFYTAISEGASASEALGTAQEKVRKRWPHPYYWAPFVVMEVGA